MYSRKIVVRYSPDIVEQPIIYELSKKYDLIFNILKARVFPRREGVIVLQLTGFKENFDEAIRFLEERGLRVDSLSKSVCQDTSRCVHCGACTAFCPTGALSFERNTWQVGFDPEKCNGCELCVTACSVRAMTVNLF